MKTIPLLLSICFFVLSCSNILGDNTTISNSSENNSVNPAPTPDPSPVPVAIKIVSTPGSSNNEVNAATLLDNTPINLFAVSVDASGDYIEDVSVSWSSSNALGSFSSLAGSSTTFTPNAGDGTEVITATHSSLGIDTTGNISVTFTPLGFVNLEAWFRADLGVTYDVSNLVTTWADQSTNGNDASQSGANSLKPNYVSAAINGKPALRFDGADDFLTTTGSVISGTGARTIFIVAKNISNTGTYNVLFELTDTVTTSGTNYAITTEVAVRISGNRVFNEGIAPGETKVLTVTNAAGTNSSGIDAYLDGVLSTQSSSSVQTINTLSNPAYIGQAAFASSNCNCDIAEIIAYSSQFNSTDRQTIETYLKNKYGL